MAAAWSSKSDSRTPCMQILCCCDAIVVIRETTSYSPERSTSCSASALSLPPLQEKTIFSLFKMPLEATIIGPSRKRETRLLFIPFIENVLYAEIKFGMSQIVTHARVPRHLRSELGAGFIIPRVTRV